MSKETSSVSYQVKFDEVLECEVVEVIVRRVVHKDPSSVAIQTEQSDVFGGI